MTTSAKNGQHNQAHEAQAGAGGTLPGSPWGVTLVTCALVVTGHMLGVPWLREPVLGLPAGLWVIGLATALFARPVRTWIASTFETGLRALGLTDHAEQLATQEPGAGWSLGYWPTNPIVSTCLDGLTRVASLLVKLAWLPLWGGEMSGVGDARRRFEHWIENAALPTRPLRVGLCLPDEEADALIASEGGTRVEWFRMGNWDDPLTACRRHCFDAAVYHDGEGPLRIVTLERPGHAAGVVEWADLTGELNFGKLFPGRVDPAAVVIEGASGIRIREGAGLVRALVEAAAVMARAELRLTLSDRVLGRRATDRVSRPAGLSLWKSLRSPAFEAMTSLAKAASDHAAHWPEAASVAADAAGAYFVSAPDAEPLDRKEALRGVEAAGETCAKTALRLGASNIAALEDDSGLAWLVKADNLLREGATPLADLDHAAFLESELSHGSDDPMGVGRAAAGITMVCASTDPTQLPFLRDDMSEEMAYAGWLVGRDQDRGLLIRVFLELQRAHEIDEPAATEAA